MGAGDFRTITVTDAPPGTRAARPGVMLVTTAGVPTDRVFFFDGGPLRFGRERDIATGDPAMSGAHVAIESLGGGTYRVTDLGSKNGTLVNGAFIRGDSMLAKGPCTVVRMGQSHALICDDLAHYEMWFIRTEGTQVIGFATNRALIELERAARKGVDVLIRGETGTGKEAAAAAYHAATGRGRRPMATLNCAEVAPTLAESTLFGAKKGAASGVTAQPGLFREGDGSTVFLDEIGELPLDLQAKLLRVLQERVVRPLGAAGAEKVDFRFVCATHRDLAKMVSEGRFREDLYMRISPVTVELPPLRERREEIPHLIALVLQGTQLRPTPHFTETCLLQSWPGNVRQLMGAVRAAALRAEGQAVLGVEHLAAEFRGTLSAEPYVPPEPPRSLPPDDDEKVVMKEAKLADLKRHFAATGSARKAAALAGVPRMTGRRWLIREGLIKEGDDET